MAVVEKGPPIGEQHHGRDIPAWIVTDDGVRHEYVRPAQEDRQGRVPLDQLRRGECVLAPGLIYRRS
jgi:hypothetical protein